MPNPKSSLSDETARRTALTVHDRTLLVEAGAGTGKTALMAGRVAMLLASGTEPAKVVAITYTEAAAAELLERIEGFVQKLSKGDIPPQLQVALPDGLSAEQEAHLRQGAQELDEITCTTIHGFCQQLVRPYPVESKIDPSATIIEPATAELAYADLMHDWLSETFGRTRDLGTSEASKSTPKDADTETFFVTLAKRDLDGTIKLIQKLAAFVKEHRTAKASNTGFNPEDLKALHRATDTFSNWYRHCGVVESGTAETIEDIRQIAEAAHAATLPLSLEQIVNLLFLKKPKACLSKKIQFKIWKRKTKWKNAAKEAGHSDTEGESLNNEAAAYYEDCNSAYTAFHQSIITLAYQKFVGQFSELQQRYQDYKQNAAVMDFDDLLHHARKLLQNHPKVRAALAERYPCVLVDEFQDTDPIQSEILWLLGGEGDSKKLWQTHSIRPGALFLVGDPKQAIYRFRGADVATYLEAKKSLQEHDSQSVLNITTNFRSQPAILEFVNDHFASMLDQSNMQPGFTPLDAFRTSGPEASVASFEITLTDEHKNEKGNLDIDKVRNEEANIVARMIADLIGTHPIWDNDLGKYRPVKAGEIALLAPTGTSLWIYENALENLGIPIAPQAGKGFFRRQETHDLLALTRAISDQRDTLAFGALLRGPLVGLTEEEIADEIESLIESTDSRRLQLWTDTEQVSNPILKQTLRILQSLTRKARQTTPYQLLAEAIERLNVRPILKARSQREAERSLANVDLFLEMSKAYAGRGIHDFSRALWQRWNDTQAQVEGRPDASSDAVSFVTMHSAKGLEWPIVIPINSTTQLLNRSEFLWRRQDETVHFKLFDSPSPEYDQVKDAEIQEESRERVRLWYVALTRASDLLLLPKQNERIDLDWFSLIQLDLDSLPIRDIPENPSFIPSALESSNNQQDLATWQAEAAQIAATTRTIQWHQPSRHGATSTTETLRVFSDADDSGPFLPSDAETSVIKGSPQRGLILHKLMEEILTGELSKDETTLCNRAAELLDQQQLPDSNDPVSGLSSKEMGATIVRTLKLDEIASILDSLRPEYPVYSSSEKGNTLNRSAGIADAVAIDDNNNISTIIDWKSDISPNQSEIDHYRSQVSHYLNATGAHRGLIVYLTSGKIDEIITAE